MCLHAAASRLHSQARRWVVRIGMSERTRHVLLRNLVLSLVQNSGQGHVASPHHVLNTSAGKVLEANRVVAYDHPCKPQTGSGNTKAVGRDVTSRLNSLTLLLFGRRLPGLLDTILFPSRCAMLAEQGSITERHASLSATTSGPRPGVSLPHHIHRHSRDMDRHVSLDRFISFP
jgi:hypothetical protein